jgi:glycosyltransferase involved in cell wall biosynthesis
MNILSISGILPIPGIRKENDFLIPLFESFKKKFPDTKIFFILPNKYNPFIKETVSIIKLKKYMLNNFPVSIYPYISSFRFQNIHAILAYTSFYLNINKIRNFLKTHNINIIHAEYIIPDGVLAYLIYKYFKIPYILTTHKEERYFNKSISKKISVKTLRSAKFVAPLNYHSHNLYKEYGIYHSIVIPHGIDNRFFNHQCSYGQNKTVRLLTIARLLDWKNIDKVLFALNNLFEKEKIDFNYTIVGKGPEEENLKTISKNLKISHKIVFKDRIPYQSIPEEMCKFDIFILPSYFETFGRVFFEAMSVGLPIIYAKNTGIHGYCKEMEEALSVNHNDVTDIADKLRLLIQNDDLRKKIGTNGRKLMQKYTWDKIADKFHELYIEALED